jgi:hypothetical protein
MRLLKDIFPLESAENPFTEAPSTTQNITPHMIIASGRQLQILPTWQVQLLKVKGSDSFRFHIFTSEHQSLINSAARIECS